MKTFFKISLLILLSAAKVQAEDLCEFFMYCPGSSSRNGGKSLPSAIISGSLNPGTLSKIKGLGVEAVFQSNNPVALGLVTGTGKIGALLSSSQENSFFGNRSIELDYDFYRRNVESKRYKNKKFAVAAGMGLYDKKDFALDIGFTLKRNPDIKKINPGIGLNGNFGFFTFGYSVYKDDTRLDLTGSIDPVTGVPHEVLFGTTDYKETFTVSALALGFKVGSAFFDYGLITTRYKFYNNEPTMIKLYSASYNKKKWLFNIAFRSEISPNAKFDRALGVLVMRKEEKDVYMGIQYSFNKHLLLGVAYNRYLLDDGSLSMILSF